LAAKLKDKMTLIITVPSIFWSFSTFQTDAYILNGSYLYQL